jgi:glutamate/tyrosine decarboxylase-like PLP-dependent enzyme
MEIKMDSSIEGLRDRSAPMEMDPEEFRKLGYQLVDTISDFIGYLPDKPVNRSDGPSAVKAMLGQGPLPTKGTPAGAIVSEAAELLFNHSLFNGHPRFWGYITSSAAPIGALADLLAAAINPNVGAWIASPMATEIEAQTISWIAELIGYPSDCGGLLVSGGNMANFVCFLAARQVKLSWNVRKEGMKNHDRGRLRVYCSADTHTWIEKANDQFGLGTDSVRWIQTNDKNQMDLFSLRDQIEKDLSNGDSPFMVVGTAGSVAVGAVDDLPALAEICREYGLWFHVDGAYGALAACLPDASTYLKGLREADSVAVDPHKWLYAPLEAGCALVRDPQVLIDTFSYHPSYYKFDEVDREAPLNYIDLGPQNSRGFRALKVWMGLRQVGRQGYIEMISDDARLARHLFSLVDSHETLEPFTQNLSITTFRYVPAGLEGGSAKVESYLNRLNEELLARLQLSGEAFLSNAVIGDKYLLRACIVNFRTSLEDIEALPEIVVRIGREVDIALRQEELALGPSSG